jgi:hypothetical protein
MFTVWRPPTQKESMALYEHGIVALASDSFITLSNMQGYFWTSSQSTQSALYSRGYFLAQGPMSNDYRTTAYMVICIS